MDSACPSSALISKLLSLTPLIEEIRTISGTPGISVGVLHAKRIIHRANYGYRDVERQIRPDSNTVYGLGSLTKAFTSAGIGFLVDEAKVDWNTKVHEILPNFDSVAPCINDQASLVDLLAHRTAVARPNSIWYGSGGDLLLSNSQAVPIYNALKPIGQFRGQFNYSNWGYALAGNVIELLSGESYSSYLESRILDPLGMKRTSANRSRVNDSNVAVPYAALDDSSFHPLPLPKAQDGTIMNGAQGMRGTVNDLLIWCSALVATQKLELDSDAKFTKPSPLKNVATQMSAHIAMSIPHYREVSYGLGWARTQLPGKLGSIGCNGMFVKRMPTIYPGKQQQLVIYHQGSLAGYTSALILLPETNSAIVVLTNSIGLGDCADWISQLVLETLIDNRRNDFVEFAKEAAKGNILHNNAIGNRLNKEVGGQNPPKPLQAYVGEYYNSIRNFYIDVRMKNDTTLELRFQGLGSQVWDLRHHSAETFVWFTSRDNLAKRAMFTYAGEDLYKIHFMTDDNGQITFLLWKHDADLEMPEAFSKL